MSTARPPRRQAAKVPAAGPELNELEATVRHLAAIHRPSASEGERQAAEWIAETLRGFGCRARVEEESATGQYWQSVGALSALSTLGGATALAGAWALGVVAGAVAAAALADDIDSGPRLFRRLLPDRSTWNVVAETGDPEADRTLVVLVHHDAAHSGFIFNPALQEGFARRFPKFIERANTSAPLWFPVVAGPALVGFGSLARNRAMVAAGALVSAVATAAMADIGSRDAVPGANDNLTGVAAMIATARALRDHPVQGVRVMLVSCGSEESLQEGVIAFARRHFPELPRERTWFLVLDTVGSPRLVMVEAEGVLRMRDYHGRFKSIVRDEAAAAGIELVRGTRARSSTDAVIPNRAHYPTALLTSFNQYKALSNYHWPTDTADNVDYSTVADAARLTEAVIRRLPSVSKVS